MGRGSAPFPLKYRDKQSLRRNVGLGAARGKMGLMRLLQIGTIEPPLLAALAHGHEAGTAGYVPGVAVATPK